MHKGTLSYFVKKPYRMKTKDDLCVVVFHNTENYGYLYHAKNNTGTWKPSDFFSGILSVDYLSEVELRITTKANITIGTIEGTVEVLVDGIPDKLSSLYLRLRTSRPLVCHVFLSKNCSQIVMTTTEEDNLISTKEIDKKECGYWDTICRYNCQGIIGTFYPPNTAVEAPLNSFYDLTGQKTNLDASGNG